MPDIKSMRITGWSKPVVFKIPEKLTQLFHSPFFTLQDAQSMVDDLTYRKINDWDSKGLISCSRDNEEAGWRRFSIIDILKLSIISHLRKFGVTTEKIKIILDRLSSGFKVPASSNSDKIVGTTTPLIESNIISCFGYEKVFLLIGENANASFLTEKELSIQNSLDGAPSSLLVLPFSSYVQNIIMSLHKHAKTSEDPFIIGMINHWLSDREQKILDVIRDKAYEEITIVKGNGSEMTLRAKSRQRGSFSDKDAISIINNKDYQSVTVAVVGGKKLSITREETIKV